MLPALQFIVNYSRTILMFACLFFSKEEKSDMSTCYQLWQDGLLLSGAQNFARELMETPSNLMTPTVFADQLTERLSDLQNVEVHSRYIYMEGIGDDDRREVGGGGGC